MTSLSKAKGIIHSLAAATFLIGGSAFAESVAPVDVEFVDMTVTGSLTGAPGDPVAGRETFADRKKGNCLACHVNADLNEQLFHGEVGPELNGVADRWSSDQLRAIVINSKLIFGEQTIMPGFYTTELGARVDEKHAGKTVLSAKEVEDVVAYLTTLSE